MIYIFSRYYDLKVRKSIGFPLFSFIALSILFFYVINTAIGSISDDTRAGKPIAAFKVFPSSGVAPLTVKLINRSKRASSYLWQFDDGKKSKAKSPSHIYTRAGKYIVRLTATNSLGSSRIKKGILVLTPSLPRIVYPRHTGIVATTFWVGEIFNGALPNGSQVCSTYDSRWAFHWSGGVDLGRAGPRTNCRGAPIGGCDGVPSGMDQKFKCLTQARKQTNGYFPTSPRVHPAENPFYLDLPFDDINDPTAFGERCQVIPWAARPGLANHCFDHKFSYMKNRWVRLVGATGKVCYGQIEDAGPSHGSLYHDATYVFGADNAKPIQGRFNNAGLDVSPALNGCLGFKALNGDNDIVSWQFVDKSRVPDGPWKKIISTRQVF